MKKLPLVPRPTSWLGAIFLYFFLGFYGAVAVTVIPRLVEIGEESPRLAALGYLALWVAPIPCVGLGHHLATLFLDRADKRSATGSVLPGLAALWAGVYAWFVMFFALSVVAILQMILFPPESAMTLARSFTWPYAAGGSLGLHTFMWVGLAAELYELERTVRDRAKKGEA